MPFLPLKQETRSELIYICRETFYRLGSLNEAKKKELLKALANILRYSIIDPPNNNLLFTTLLAITASSNYYVELNEIWKCIALWRHQQAMLIHMAMGLLCAYGEQLWLDTICKIFGWIKNELVVDLLFSLLTPKNITSRTEISLTIECQSLLDKVKTSSKRSKKQLYEPKAVSNAQIAFSLLCLTKTRDRNNLLLFHAIIFAFDTIDPFIRSLALEFLDIEKHLTFDEYASKLALQIEGNSDLEAQLVNYSFEYGCRCNLKSASTLSWRLFPKFAVGTCTESQIIPGVLDLLRNMGKSMRSLEKGQFVLEACLDALFLIAEISEVNDMLLMDLIIILLNSPIESLYYKGYSLLLLSGFEEDDLEISLLRGLFVLEEVRSKSKVVQFYYWVKQLLLMNETDYLKPQEFIDPTLLVLYNRTSLRSQFWPKLIQHAKSFDENDSEVNFMVCFLEAWCQKGKNTVNFVNLCQAASFILPKDTLLSLIDRLADMESPKELVDSCTNILIDEFDSRPDETEVLKTMNPFIISVSDFDVFQEVLEKIYSQR